METDIADGPKISLHSLDNQKCTLLLSSEISNIKNEIRSIDSSDSLSISDVHESKLIIDGETESIRIANISNSTIKVKQFCRGAIYIERVSGGKLIIAGDQIRIHDSEGVHIYMYTRSSCVLENCSGLVIHPYNIHKEDFNAIENNWKCVQSFDLGEANNYTYSGASFDEDDDEDLFK